jgi:8-oxo-dGTP pyrophosphatase MutT (NUDIX family)
MRFGNILAGIKYQERPAAYALITDGEGRIAAVQGRRGYFLPGGGSLPEEKPEETIARELREELARGVRIIFKIGEAVQYFSAGDEHYRMTALFYVAEFTGEQEGAAEYDLHWLNIKEVEETFFHECQKWAVRRSGLLIDPTLCIVY